MNERFPFGYDLNAYIDKAFEQMKADFPWATRDMIAEHTCFGISIWIPPAHSTWAGPILSETLASKSS